MNRKFIIASFNLYWNGSPNSWDNAARQVLRLENESKVYYYIVLFQLKWFSEQDSITSPPFRSEVNRARMQFERPCDARRPVVSVSRFIRYRLLIYALIRSLRRRNVSLVKLCVTDVQKFAEVEFISSGEERYSRRQQQQQSSSSSFDMDWDQYHNHIRLFLFRVY